ncbi:MAG: penicillin-binding protein 1C [Proteobacteria bacterium]|nr:penicillin-binding protein 1C [Pseudomonadota bacterium]
MPFLTNKTARLLLAFVAVFISLFIASLYILPPPLLLKNKSFSKAIYDKNDKLLRLSLSQDEKYRLFTPLNKIDKKLIEATLLQEDQYFFKHIGVNPWAMIKAGFHTYVLKTRRVGASTISMQLARMLSGIESRHVSGKLQQIFYALQLEMHYSKAEILEAYLNLAPYGHNIEGIGAASLVYYTKSADKLSLAEALTLAIIPQNPNVRISTNKQLKEIRGHLFERWLQSHPKDDTKRGMINLPLAMGSLKALPFKAPHFVNEVMANHRDHEQKIKTTLDLKLQTIVQRITNRYLSQKTALGVNNASVLLVDSRDLSILALLGSADFFNSSISGQINGTNIKRSPGSTLKPFIYGLALDQGLIHPYTVLKDVPYHFGNYNPENFDYDFMGPIKAKDALILSRNIPAIFLASQLKPNLHELLVKSQISQLRSESFYGLSLSLGSAELTIKELASLYAALVNDGLWKPLRSEASRIEAQEIRLLSRESSFLILDMLKDTPRPGFNFLSHAPKDISWKTGTSSGYRDAWSVGNFGPFVLVIWIGNFDNKSNQAFVGKNIAAPLFFDIITAIKNEIGVLPLENKNPEWMNLRKVEVCKASGLLPTRFCLDREMSWFIPGKSPIKHDNIYREIPIDKKTGLRSCQFNENTRFEIYEFWPSDILKIFKQAGIQRKKPPPFAESCHFNEEGLQPQISSPESQLKYVLNNQFKYIPFTAITDAGVKKIHWFINERYLGKVNAMEPFIWPAKIGKYVVRVVDDQGRSDAKDLVITGY